MAYKNEGQIACTLCGKTKIAARHLCRRCYNFERAHDRLGKHEPRTRETTADIFLKKIRKTDTCWLWTGHCNDYGYGIILLPGEIPTRAHRFSYEHFKGPIKKGLIVMHTCDNPPCVNPEHLRIGTKDDNNKDTALKRRHNYGLDHWNGRLSDKAVENIRASDETGQVLALRHGVSIPHIYRIKARIRRV